MKTEIPEGFRPLQAIKEGIIQFAPVPIYLKSYFQSTILYFCIQKAKT